MLRIFIGYDSREPIAYHVLSHSIMTRASCQVSIAPLIQEQLRDRKLYWRERKANESTEFSITRFLVPYLCDYQGWALFMDCDMLCLTDMKRLLGYAAESEDKAVLVCKHDYEPKTTEKFLGHVQESYPCKNWSSFMLLNCARCKALTPETVNTATGLELHRFYWSNADRIGELPLEWNWLVGEYGYHSDAKVVHYTLGGPWFPEYARCDYSGHWFRESEHIGY